MDGFSGLRLVWYGTVWLVVIPRASWYRILYIIKRPCGWLLNTLCV